MFANTLHAESSRLLKTLGQRLRAERERQGIPASLFAQRIQVSRPTLRDMEAGAPGPHISHWIRAFAALGRGSELENLLAPNENLIELMRQPEPKRRSRVRRR